MGLLSFPNPRKSPGESGEQFSKNCPESRSALDFEIRDIWQMEKQTCREAWVNTALDPVHTLNARSFLERDRDSFFEFF